MKRFFLCTAVCLFFLGSAFSQTPGITSGASYKIKSLSNQRLLNVNNSSLSDGENVNTWTDTGSDAERWIVTHLDSSAYLIQSAGTGKYLYAANAGIGENVTQFQDGGNDKIYWSLSSNGDGTFTIQAVANTGVCLTLNNGDDFDGANVVLANSSSSDEQKWYFTLSDEQEAAPTDSIAALIFDAWSKYFNIPEIGGFWGTAEMMEIVLDAYEVSGDTKYVELFNHMYDNFVSNNGEDWMGNEYNDDIAWISIACVRSYILTGNETHLAKAKDQFDKMFVRGNTHQFGSDLLVWKMGTEGTNSCINGPAMVCCCYLAQALGDTSYYDKAINLYNWSKKYLFNEYTGKVNDWYNAPETGSWSSTYNQGTYLGASMLLYKYTGDIRYLQIADKIADYTRNNMYQNGIMNNEEGGNDLPGFKGIFMRYARRYVVEANRPEYAEWLRLNAKVAYNNRNSGNIILTNWGTRTNEGASCDCSREFSASTAVSLMVNCPQSSDIARAAYQTIEAEDFNYFSQVLIGSCSDGGRCISAFQNGAYTGYSIDFGPKGPAEAEFRYSCEADSAVIEIRAGSHFGALLGTAKLTGTGSLDSYATLTCQLSNELRGLQPLYLVFKGADTDILLKLDHFLFHESSESTYACFYRDCDYAGTEIMLGPGSYTTTDMFHMGIRDNDISSLKVSPGYKVILYSDDYFTGSVQTISSDITCLVSLDFNDKVSSLRVEDESENTPPGVRITTPAQGAWYDLDSLTLNVSATATDADGTIKKVSFYLDDIFLGSDESNPYVYRIENLPKGSYSLKALVSDDQDAEGSSETVYFLVKGKPRVDITDAGGSITAQYTDSPAAERIGNLIDNEVMSKFLTFHQAAWIIYHATGVFLVDSYSFTSANDAELRDPKNWTLEGSNDGTNWTNIDTRNNQDFPYRFERKYYDVANPGEYEYYRLNISNDGANELQLSELELFGTEVLNTSSTTKPGLTNGGSGKPVLLYPNPVKNSLCINTAYTNYSIEIYTLAGLTVYKSTGNNGESILNTKDLSNGIYLIQLSTEDESYTGKISVCH